MSTGYGREAWCTDSFVTTRFVTGSRLVAQALYRRLITPRGTLAGGDEESIYGFDVSGFIGAVGSVEALIALPGLVRAECLKDDRVLDVDVTSTTTDDGAGNVSILLEIAGTLADETGDFTLTLSATAAALVLLEAA